MAMKQHFNRYVGPERRTAKPSPATIALALAALAAIAYATLCPIGMRPHLASADEERFGAYFVLGFLLALAAPRRRWAVTLLVVAVAIGLEAGQLLIPGRDGRVWDAFVKAVGGGLGAQTYFTAFALKRFVSRQVQTYVARARADGLIDHNRP
jgi:hypothetical protein